jgi:hypothetical protein
MARYTVALLTVITVWVVVAGGVSIPSVGLPAGAAAATEPLSAAPPPKTERSVATDPLHSAPARRVGGDDVAAAVPIDAIPYTDTGNTCDFGDDYDEVCPYSISTSPDVVYSYTPNNWILLDIDLCGSAYDTKLYVYDEDLSLVACNDDYYYDDMCGVYVSALMSLPLDADELYYIIIDGYGGDCGQYTLQIAETSICVLECPDQDSTVYENEPPLMDEYEDLFNSGCGAPESEPLFSELCGDENGERIFCGISGWYIYQGFSYRDTDWILVQMGETGTLTWTGDAEVPTYMFHLAPTDCSEVAVAQAMEVGACIPNTMTITGEPAAVIWLWIGPQQFEPPYGFNGNEFNYVMTLEGIAECPVAVEASSWSRVKGLYR